MLAHFSVLTAFFSFLGVFCALRRRFVDVLTVFFVFWRPPGSIFTVQGWFFRLQNAICQCFCAPARAQSRNVRHATKPQFFLGFCMVFTHRKHGVRATARRKIVPGACRTKLPAKIVLKTRLGVNSEGGLALSWASLGRLLFALGRLLASLGCFWDVSWAFLARSWLSLGSAGTVQRRILAPRTVPGFDFNGFGDAPDWVLMNFWDMFCFALRCTSHFVT